MIKCDFCYTDTEESLIIHNDEYGLNTCFDCILDSYEFVKWPTYKLKDDLKPEIYEYGVKAGRIIEQRKEGA